MTALPLICFGAAATRVPLITLGLLQYLAPTLHFVIGVFFFDEECRRRAGWLRAVWVALALFTVDSLRHRRRQLTRLAGRGLRGLTALGDVRRDRNVRWPTVQLRFTVTPPARQTRTIGSEA